MRITLEDLTNVETFLMNQRKDLHAVVAQAFQELLFLRKRHPETEGEFCALLVRRRGRKFGIEEAK